MRFLIWVALIFIGHTAVWADGFPSDIELHLDISKKGQLSIYENKKTKRIRLTHEVIGYEVNCAKTRIMAWGKPKNLNKNNPQESTLTIINLKSRTKISRLEFNKNIYDVKFLDNGINAIIESDTERLVDIILGKLTSLNDNDVINIKSDPENCIAFPHKSYRKYKN
jgi:hypothetical protein